MTAWRSNWPGQTGGLLAVGMLMMALLLAAPPAHAQTITKITDLDFGTCEDVGGTTYTVAAASSPGVSACAGAHAAVFTVTGTASALAKLSYSNVTVTNGTASLSATLTDSAGGSVCLGTAGSATVYVGGSIKFPHAGLGSSGVLSTSTTISVAYQGKKTC